MITSGNIGMFYFFIFDFACITANDKKYRGFNEVTFEILAVHDLFSPIPFCVLMNNYLRGYKIYNVGSKWFFDDTKQPTIETWEGRPCGYCGRFNTVAGHDGCLGILPKVANACCGHGQEGDAYLQFNDGTIAFGKEAIKMILSMKKI